ncbi:uncharacterized protein LOC122087713 [Macadamia integrifolia]|uniref:uncharacterized protein LOC122087713 n=1 Tax=Macadamia integrifolia TaxID=60698 RepID=UPI001C501B04|nr:uncharacterized protein LOC122087713 [Macadamia integrifolia]
MWTFQSISRTCTNREGFQFLMGLNEAYSTVRTQILTMEPLPNIGKAYSLVLQEEKHKGLHLIQTMSSDTAALAANHGNSTQADAGYRSNSGQNRSATTDTNRFCRRPYCSHCNKHGHTRETCYELHGYTTGHSKRNANFRSNLIRDNHVHTVASVAPCTETSTIPAANVNPPSLPPLTHTIPATSIIF